MGNKGILYVQPYPKWDLFIVKITDLNETQGGILNVVFRVADEMGMLLIDLKDLKAMLKYVADNLRKLQQSMAIYPNSL